MITLTNGYKLPQSPDRGFTFFPALEFNIQRLNDHTHDGVDSEKIDASAIDSITQTILAAGWVSLGSGNYRQLVTVPGGINLDTIGVQFRIASGAADGHYITPSVEKVSVTQYYIYINDNTVDVKAFYG